jgi:hypothetical protein
MNEETLKIDCEAIDSNIDKVNIIYYYKTNKIKISVYKGDNEKIVHGTGSVTFMTDNGEYIGWVYANINFDDEYWDEVISSIGSSL